MGLELLELAKAAHRPPDEIAAIVFIDIAIIMVVARLAGALFRKIRQPAVVGEILAGIALGPSLLGAFPGHLTDRVFPTDVRPFLNVLAQLGLIIFMFIVGLELDANLIRGKERIAATISLSSIALPFVMGIGLAGFLHASHQGAENADRFLPFALFIGASMSITAFPVLARILTERRMYRTEIGALTLACAAVDDILAWSLLAVVLAIVTSSGILDLPRILVESLLFVGFMFVVVKPRLELLADRYRRDGRLTPDILAIIIVGFLVSAYVTSKIGIHSIFGAFIFGVVMPRKDTADFFHNILERLESVSLLVLLPVFFIVTGFGVDVRGLGREALFQLPLILLVAIVGKLVGATLGARAQGIPGRKAAAIGVLMNTRGLTELVILNVGREVGVLDQRLFTMLVIMAVVTTIMTEPALRLVYPDRLLQRDIAEAEMAALGVIDAYRVVVEVGDPGRAAALVDTAIDIVGDQQPAEIVLTSFRPVPRGLEVVSGLGGELAEVAATLERLKELAERAEARGVSCVVRSQFSEDIGRDLVEQAGAVEADVLLMGSDSGGRDTESAQVVAALVGQAPMALVLLTDPLAGGIDTAPSRPIVVEVGQEGPDSAAALEVAVRLARSRHAQVCLVAVGGSRKAARRASGWAGDLNRAGLGGELRTSSEASLASVVADVEGAACVVVGYGDRNPADGGEGPSTATGRAFADVAGVPVLVVRAAADDDGRNLDRLLKRVAPPAEADEHA